MSTTRRSPGSAIRSTVTKGTVKIDVPVRPHGMTAIERDQVLRFAQQADAADARFISVQHPAR